ncbi:MAG: hypothetical protein QOI31_980 [Solirubrobacterales bacterium]|nr:hypothetical protein [Solirubrobacterales bacterium]
MPGWPPLAWVARCGDVVELWHGPRVEVGAEWAYEGAWDGDFAGGAFDQVAVSLGSGVRIRGEEAVFVSPTSTIDRLCHLVAATGETSVSNSLLALLETAGAEMTEPKYQARVTSIVKGIDRCRSTLETSAGPVHLTHFRNLAWSSGRLERRDKPIPSQALNDFGAYRTLLAGTFAKLGANMADPARHFPLAFLGTLSSGYDANAATALAAEAGCRRAICFETTGSGHPDSGVPVAEALGIEPIVIEREAWREVPQLPGGTEVPFLAAGGGSGLVGFHGAQAHLEGAVLVSGFYGDSIWNPEWSKLGPDVVRKDASGLGFCEYRLHAGFVNCAPAFWAARQVADVVAISRSAEMAPWMLGAGYDRPIPRRIAEEAGVPRDAFGKTKRAVPKAQPHRDRRFLTPEASGDYFAWLRENRSEEGMPSVISPALDRAQFARRDISLRAHVALGRLPALRRSEWWKRRRKELRRRHRSPTPLRAHAVAWALDRGRRAYAEGKCP